MIRLPSHPRRAGLGTVGAAPVGGVALGLARIVGPSVMNPWFIAIR
jgi:hypothetical protein